MVKLKFRTPTNEADNKRFRSQLTKLLSQRIQTIRKEKKITQQELAESAGLHLTYIGHLEAGKYHPSTFVLWKIAQVLEVPMDDFINS